YMAPETVKHNLINERTDIYNFGATMYRLVTWRNPSAMVGQGGGLPMDAKTFANMLKPVCECNAEAPPAFSDIIHHCIDYNARNRPERVSEVQGALDHLADELIRSPEDRLEAF